MKKIKRGSEKEISPTTMKTEKDIVNIENRTIGIEYGVGNTTKKNKDEIHRKFRERHKKNPKKYQARYKLRYAVKIGKLQRPNKCAICKKECKPEAHHHDYNKPYEVIWVCRMCHTKEDGGGVNYEVIQKETGSRECGVTPCLEGTQDRTG